MSMLGLFKRNTNIIKKIDKSNSYSFDYQKNSYIFYAAFESEVGRPSRGLVHPRTRVGGGARWIQVPAQAGTQETMGGAGRSEATGVPREGLPTSDSTPIIKKRLT